MRMRSRVPLGASWALLLVLAACGGARSGSPEDRVQVRVNNNLVPPTALTVYAVSDAGSRRLLGSVSPNQEITLTFDPGSAGGSYRLMARTLSGAEIVSNPVFIRTGGGVSWTLQSNIAVPR